MTLTTDISLATRHGMTWRSAIARLSFGGAVMSAAFFSTRVTPRQSQTRTNSNYALHPLPLAATLPPELRRVRFRDDLDMIAWQSVPGIAVTRNGRIAIASDVAVGSREGMLLQIISTSLDTTITVGRRGEGPGELSGTDRPFASGDTIHVFNMRRLVDVMYSDGGKYLGERRLHSTMSEAMVQFLGDSVDVQPLQHSTRDSSAGPSRRRIGETRGRPIFPASDSFVRRLLAPQGGSGLVRGVAYASNATLLAIGDPVAYRIGIYKTDGTFLYFIKRILPPHYRSATEIGALRKSLTSMLQDSRMGRGIGGELRSRLDTLERETVPWFGSPGLAYDTVGRLWVIGQLGDATFADAFSGSTFLGRQMLPCARPGRRFALQGKWIALHCEVATSAAAPFQIQLYAIPD
jgi:hypothetical protein